MNKILTYKYKKFLKVKAAKIERMARKRNVKKNLGRINDIKEYIRNRHYRDMAKGIKSYDDVLNLFLPKNLRYLAFYPKSPVYVKKRIIGKVSPKIIVLLPSNFSILSNPKESYDAMAKLVKALICQQGREVWVDYSNCKSSDLLTQIFLDSIFKDWDRFAKLCIRANILKYMNVVTIGGQHYHNPAIQKMLNSVGSPKILLNRKYDYEQVIPFHLRYFDKQEEDSDRKGYVNDIDTTLLIEYVNKCLNKVGKELTQDSADALGTVIAEPVINASEHSSLQSRYLIGYFEDYSDEDEAEVHGILNLVILNYGKSVYEKFKYPDPDEKINFVCVEQMKELSKSYNSKNLFRKQEFQESTLWTLYALQQGVTVIPDANRGNGTIKFIDKFFNLQQDDDKNESRMYFISGNTVIEFDGSYGLTEISDEFDNKRTIMAFNNKGSLWEKPDKKYVRYSDWFFPGTALYARIVLNSKITKNDTD